MKKQNKPPNNLNYPTNNLLQKPSFGNNCSLTPNSLTHRKKEKFKPKFIFKQDNGAVRKNQSMKEDCSASVSVSINSHLGTEDWKHHQYSHCVENHGKQLSSKARPCQLPRQRSKSRCGYSENGSRTHQFINPHSISNTTYQINEIEQKGVYCRNQRQIQISELRDLNLLQKQLNYPQEIEEFEEEIREKGQFSRIRQKSSESIWKQKFFEARKNIRYREEKFGQVAEFSSRILKEILSLHHKVQTQSQANSKEKPDKRTAAINNHISEKINSLMTVYALFNQEKYHSD